MLPSSLKSATRVGTLLLVVLLNALNGQTTGNSAELPERDPRLQWTGPLSALHRRLAGRLRECRKEGAQTALLLSRLTAPGAEAIEPLLDMLVQGRVPRANDDDTDQLLSTSQRQLLLSALAQLPAKRVRMELESRLLPPPAVTPAPVRIAVLWAKSVIGCRSDLLGLSALAPREGDDLSPAAAEALRSAYASILRREPGVLASGLRLLQSCDAAAAQQLLLALGDLGDRRALPLLDVCARSMPDLAQEAVALVPLVGASHDPAIDQPLAAWLGEQLDLERPEWDRASLRAIGVLDDGSQVPVLIGQLEAEHPGLREAALASLQRISGQHLGPSAEAWREWYARESVWQTKGRIQAEVELHSNKDVLVANALNAYAEHSLFRDQLAEDVLQVLDHGSLGMRVMACSTLARIGSARAVLPLIANLSDDDPVLAEAAWHAACVLTGQTLPSTTQEARDSWTAP